VRWRPRTLRGRLTLIFALVTLALSVLVGVLVDVQYRTALTSALDQGLETRYLAAVQQIAAAANASTPKPAIPDAEAFAQVIDRDGVILAGAPGALRLRAVLAARELRQAARRRITLESTGPRGERVRLLAGPTHTRGEVAVVGTSLEEVTSAQHRLELALAIGLPLLAGLVTLVGWFVAGAALSPVQEMIEDADAISARAAGQLSRRLTVSEHAGEELIDLAHTLNQLLERLEGALEHERAFLDDASHELRTPIAIARGELELARLQAPDGSDTATSLDSALEEIDRLDHLASSLLVLARTRAAGPPPRARFALGDVARSAVQAATAVSARTTPAVSVTVTGDAPVRGDAAAIERAVRNLVENALRYADHEVAVVIESDDAEAVLEVHDDGPGFPPEWMQHGVSRFSAGDSPASHGGASLGLAIVDAIVQAHGGRLEIGDPEGDTRAAGACVRVHLPAEDAELLPARS